MPRVDVVVIGAGQAGLALSRCLTERHVDHVVLERGQIAERWRSERWDSLRLLTPNWQTRLPHFCYDGDDPDGYMDSREVAGFLTRYAESFAAPVELQTPVTRVSAGPDGFTIATTRGTWTAAAVAIATGYCDQPAVPRCGVGITPAIQQLTPSAYVKPSMVASGGVLVVGASASGIQIAHELRQEGRSVVLAVGRHLRVPRTYRGRDVMWWLDHLGVLAETTDSLFDREASQSQPSFQLVGRPDRASLSLADLHDVGVVLTGRLLTVSGATAHFDDSLLETTAAADAKLALLLERIDRFVYAYGIDQVGNAEPFTPHWPRFVNVPSPQQLDLEAAGVKTILWATGYRREYPWLDVPGALDERGELRHDRGVSPAPGLYVIGLPFLSRRNSAFIDGVGHDAVALAEHITQRLRQRAIA
jgi:putative flavoprotein involved in K+ transport